uniref:ribonuclease H n=1 Tax=viral metagenome TaxID=1070528 RepID=A0A6C0FER0_9ZZZZ|tara:strand:- start:9190 stop:9825 length:636 start_codon:yes stop_codon:yes gene_type:complete
MIVTFGKYRHESVKNIIEKDYQYSQWLITQPWFTIKHKELHHQFIHEMNSVSKKEDSIHSNVFIVYTDGACKHNGSDKAKAGIGVYFNKNNMIKIPSVSERLTSVKQTNNVAELTAILRALELCDSNNITQKILIYTDSDYSMKCIEIWYPQWKKEDKMKERKNIDILQKIDKLYEKLDVEFKHIRSHTGLTDIHSKGNEMADKLAVQSLL